MDDEELEFSSGIGVLGGARTNLLDEAAGRLDQRQVHMGPGTTTVESREGEVARTFLEDQAALGRPQVYRLGVENLPGGRAQTPVEPGELERRTRFYWLEFPVSLWCRPGHAFNRLELKVAFDEDDSEGRRATTFDVLPDPAWVEHLKVDTQLALGVGADFKVGLATPSVDLTAVGIPVAAHAGADVDLQATSGLTLGPFQWALRAPKVKRSPTGLDHVFWRLDSAEFAQTQDAGLRVVLRVPRTSDGLQVRAQMRATRYFELLEAGLQRAVRDLPAAIRSFFTGGTPIDAENAWDLSDDL
jgi:hypothetical protein